MIFDKVLKMCFTNVLDNPISRTNMVNGPRAVVTKSGSPSPSPSRRKAELRI